MQSQSCESQNCEFSYFLNCEKDLESLAEDHFSAMPAEAEDINCTLYERRELRCLLPPLLLLMFSSRRLFFTDLRKLVCFENTEIVQLVYHLT